MPSQTSTTETRVSMVRISFVFSPVDSSVLVVVKLELTVSLDNVCPIEVGHNDGHTDGL